MLNFNLTMDVTRAFGESAKITDAAEKAHVRALKRFGAFLRTRARRSLRRRKKPSQPGRPPSVHSRDRVATIKNILFALGPGNRSVVTGPVRLNQKQFLGGQLQSGIVPQLMEHGGTAGFREKRVGSMWVSVGRRKPREDQPTRVRMATYKARPFMGPALEEETSGGAHPRIWAAEYRKAA